MTSQHSTYPGLRASQKQERWSRADAKASTSTPSYIAAKWHRPPSTNPSPRFSCGRHIVAALLVLIFGAATGAAVHMPTDGRGAETASAGSQQDVQRPRPL
jgi:hypothetical protein